MLIKCNIFLYNIVIIISLLFHRLWNYNPTNDNTHGDHWYGEDFSIYSRSINEEITITKTKEIKTDETEESINGTITKKIQKLKIQTDTLSIISSNKNTYINEENEKSESEISDKVNSPNSPTSPFDLTRVHFLEQDDETDSEQFHHQGGRVLEAVLVNILNICRNSNKLIN